MTAKIFVDDLASRVMHRVQITSDGHKSYLEAIGPAFGVEVDYAMLVKQYGSPNEEERRKYSPAKCLGCEKHIVYGQPEPELTHYRPVALADGLERRNAACVEHRLPPPLLLPDVITRRTLTTRGRKDATRQTTEATTANEAATRRFFTEHRDGHHCR